MEMLRIVRRLATRVDPSSGPSSSRELITISDDGAKDGGKRGVRSTGGKKNARRTMGGSGQKQSQDAK